MPLLLLALLCFAAPAGAAEDPYAPPATAKMSALDEDGPPDVVVTPTPAIVDALPAAFIGLGAGGAVAMTVVLATFFSGGFNRGAGILGPALATIAAVGLGPAIAVGIVGVPWVMPPLIGVSAAIGAVGGGIVGLGTGYLLADALRPRGTDCLGCTTPEAVAPLVTSVVGATVGGGIGVLATTGLLALATPQE